jgi:hypothetical protein
VAAPGSSARTSAQRDGVAALLLLRPVRGLFAGLKKRQGLVVEAAERVRQVGRGMEGAKGSYTVYRIAEAD